MRILTYFDYVLSCSSVDFAYPGMGETLKDLHHSAKVIREEPKQLTLKDSQLTPICKGIKGILLDEKDARSSEIDAGAPVETPDTAACKADLCLCMDVDIVRDDCQG